MPASMPVQRYLDKPRRLRSAPFFHAKVYVQESVRLFFGVTFKS